jgi:hypothetical protein
VRRLVPAALAALALAGCGAAERQRTSTSASASDRVEVVLRPNGPEGQAVTKTLNCSAVTEQCRKLREADFSPAKAQACTQVYGGPATATVKGKAGGSAVDAEFTLANGCEIDRWREFSWLLGDPPGQP